MLQVLASLSGRTHIQDPSDKSTPVWCGKKQKSNKNYNIMLLGAQKPLVPSSEVQKPLVYQDTTMTKDDDFLPLRMAPPWDMRLPGRHPPNTPCAHPSRGSNHTSELIQRSCMELRIGETRESRPIITGIVDLYLYIYNGDFMVNIYKYI